MKRSILSALESEPDFSPKPQNGGVSSNQILMYAGYILIPLAIFLIILLWLYKRIKTRKQKLDSTNNKLASLDHDSKMDNKRIFSTVESKGKIDTSAESGLVSSSLVVLTSPEMTRMRFEDLLKSPAELVGRGQHGSVYKVVCEEQRMVLAVKRIKDWQISSDVFRQRMRRLNQVKHVNVMPTIAYYSSSQEKLLVYEYQKNGSLFRLIHANGNQTTFDWNIRLSIAATIANALSFMHEQLLYDRIPHGNLKSSNIFLNKNMEPCISEYGLIFEDNQQSIIANSVLQEAQENYHSLFKADTYAFGVILLEMLTGRTVLKDGLDLASWVVTVVREEWTVEVFDKNLVRQGASEERMVNMLQVAIRCVNKPPEARPSMKEVASAISAIREDDDRSIDVSELSSMTRSFVDV
ncbi:hypothetical protein DH2020_009420 [Rehmannia glutinosa]|uniref:Protein kinase domain-containing protein n=1 Tax=Rehmannia glutinosa TaxID=99300 RepID=A0ABR0X930_REHGL